MHDLHVSYREYYIIKFNQLYSILAFRNVIILAVIPQPFWEQIFSKLINQSNVIIFQCGSVYIVYLVSKIEIQKCYMAILYHTTQYQWTRSSFIQVMVVVCSAPSHYLRQPWVTSGSWWFIFLSTNAFKNTLKLGNLLMLFMSFYCL